MKKIFLFLASLLWLLLGGCASQSTAEIPAVTGFKVDKYLGTWYEIARLPHRFEKDLDYVSAEYKLNNNGGITVVNRGVKNGYPKSVQGEAKWKGSSDVGELSVSFFWPFSGDYKIIKLDDNYQWAVVTSSTKDYLWILSRQNHMPEEQLKELLDFAAGLGFQTGLLEYPKQELN